MASETLHAFPGKVTEVCHHAIFPAKGKKGLISFVRGGADDFSESFSQLAYPYVPPSAPKILHFSVLAK